MSKTRLTYLFFIILTSCIQTEDIAESISQATGKSFRTIKIPHMAPFAGSQAASLEPSIPFPPGGENFPGWLVPLPVDVGSSIVGARAWVRDIIGAVRLEIGTNTQITGENPGRAGIEVVALSSPSDQSHTVQVLSIANQGIRVVSGTTYWLHLAFLSTDNGVVQLRGMELDVSSPLVPVME